MKRRRPPLLTMLILACCLTLLGLPGCKRKTVGSSGGMLSPSAPNYQRPAAPEAEEDDSDEQEDIVAATEEQEALRALGPPPFEFQQPDQGPGIPVAGSPEARAAIEAANARAKAEYEAKVKAHNDRVDTEKAVDAALAGALPGLRSCFTRNNASAGACTVSIRVNHLGYVLDSSTNSANAQVNACIRNTLGNIKVSGVKTGNITVQRTFNFK